MPKSTNIKSLEGTEYRTAFDYSACYMKKMRISDAWGTNLFLIRGVVPKWVRYVKVITRYTPTRWGLAMGHWSPSSTLKEVHEELQLLYSIREQRLRCSPIIVSTTDVNMKKYLKFEYGSRKYPCYIPCDVYDMAMHYTKTEDIHGITVYANDMLLGIVGMNSSEVMFILSGRYVNPDKIVSLSTLFEILEGEKNGSRIETNRNERDGILYY